MWEPRRLRTLWAFMACYRDSFTFTDTKLDHVLRQVLPTCPTKHLASSPQETNTKFPKRCVSNKTRTMIHVQTTKLVYSLLLDYASCIDVETGYEPRNQRSIAGGFSAASRVALQSTQPPISKHQGSFAGDKAAGA
jgi:hypothetical protein